MLRWTTSRLAALAQVASKHSYRPKPEGDISSVFASLSKDARSPLPERYGTLKREIVGERMEAMYQSWKELLPSLKEDLEVIKGSGNKVIPEIDAQVAQLAVGPGNDLIATIKKRGVCIVRGIFSPSEALQMKEDVIKYIQANPSTKAFPPDDPQVFELYWSPSQIKARADPRMLSVQKFFLSLWHDQDPSRPLTEYPPVTYADRLRIRRPGDAKFALGPHVDGGGVERWEDPTYRSVYKNIFDGKWRSFDAYRMGERHDANMNMYESAGGCSVFRAWQGWLSMSSTGPGEGTLRVLPLTQTSTAYWLLRPFFSPSSSDPFGPWNPDPTSLYLHGATPGRGQEMSGATHPHLELGQSMVSVPKVEPGDGVFWHGDLIHAVENVHAGSSDSSVMYIPCVPGTPSNLRYVYAQRDSFTSGIPPPDFPGGQGESRHVGRASADLIAEIGGDEALKSMGF
ncbi:DUF1479-domain-containing protein [Sistotremastrum niveocremeum HHB9708]|uniref:DUF1479-domain-containing protein n=1 Tax=Sistotremastrum niveocremeum HHB9708 TaxID=1314777 RepID=A0A164YUN8_9AGAM|nr:DUF1479-domain-containing protein [Sistotremastrum niveocremeum HHB9708]